MNNTRQCKRRPAADKNPGSGYSRTPNKIAALQSLLEFSVTHWSLAGHATGGKSTPKPLACVIDRHYIVVTCVAAFWSTVVDRVALVECLGRVASQWPEINHASKNSN